MPRRRRLSIFAVVAALWLSGCAWLCLDQFFSTPSPFGKTPHPFEPTLLLMHGILAILSMYVLGWVSARHVLRWWRARERLVSGTVLATFLTVLAVTGFALFFTSSDDWQHRAALAHEVLGIGLALLVIEHWFIGRRRSRTA